MTTTDVDHEYGAGHHHDEYGQVDAVQISVDPHWDDLDDRRPQFESKLEEQKLAVEERKKTQAEWQALPQEEKDRREAERKAKMSSMELSLERMMLDQLQDATALLNRQAFSPGSAKEATAPVGSGA